MSGKVQPISQEQSTEKTEQPDLQAEAKFRKEEATRHFDAIKGAVPTASRSSLVIGYHAHRMKVRNLFGILGFATEEEARRAADVGDSTWYSTIAIARAFEGLAEELFVSMKLTNARAMVDLPESKRMDHQWIEWATTESIEAFSKRVDEAMQGKARESDSKERTVTMKIDMPASQKKVIEEKAKDFAEAHGIEPSDTGKVLEVALAEVTSGETLIGAITNACARMKQIKDLAESGLSSDEIIERVLRLNEESILEFARVLNIAVEAAA